MRDTDIVTMSGSPNTDAKAFPESLTSAEARFRVGGAGWSRSNPARQRSDRTKLGGGVDPDAAALASLDVFPAISIEREEGFRDPSSYSKERIGARSVHLRTILPPLLLVLAVVLAVYPMTGFPGINTADSGAANSQARSATSASAGTRTPVVSGSAGYVATPYSTASVASGSSTSGATGSSSAIPSSSPVTAGATPTASVAAARSSSAADSPAAVPTISGVRAMWLWHSSLIVSAPRQILGFARSNHVNLIYLQISFATSSSAYSGFVAAATSSGISVYALGGSPNWAIDPTHAGLTGLVNWVSTYNASVAPASRFVGMNLDLEPYTLPAWTSDQSSVVQTWMANVSYLDNAANGIGLPLSLTLPFWLNQYPAGSTGMGLGLWMIKNSDLIDIMAYRSTLGGSNGVAAVASPLLSAAASVVGHKAIVAVDTTPGLSTSFTSQTSLASALDGFQPSFGQLASFGGYAVNDYENWSSLPK